MKLSIVVPVYNAEKYIDKTICSVINQLTNEDELILVDDGSIDKSLDICKKYDHHLGIKVIHQKNSGPSKARNTGIDNSSGDYVLFLDADDVVTDNWLQCIRKYIEDYKTDVLCFGYCTVRSDFRKEIDMQPEFSLYSTRDGVIKAIPDLTESFFFNVVWDKAYKTEMLKKHHIRFREDIYIGEDRQFCMDVLAVCDSWCMIPESLYRYIVQNSNSISAKCDLKRLNQMISVNDGYRNLLTLSLLSEDEQDAKVTYENVKACTSHLMDLVRTGEKRKYSYTKELRFKHRVPFNYEHLRYLSRLQKITYLVWTKGNNLLLYIYVNLLSIYKYKLKLYRESEKKL